MANVVYDFNPHNLPPDYLAAIGLVTACAAQAEEAVETLIAACLGIDAEYGMAVTSHMAVPLRDNVARAVAEIRFENLGALDELDILLDRISQAFDKRNAVIHHSWTRHPQTGHVFTVKQTARGSVKVEVISMSAEDISADAAFIYSAGIDLVRFMIAYGLKPIPPSGRPRAHKTRKARKARGKNG